MNHADTGERGEIKETFWVSWSWLSGVTVVNRGKAPDALISATADVAERVEVHETRSMAGMMMMQKVARVELAPGARGRGQLSCSSWFAFAVSAEAFNWRERSVGPEQIAHVRQELFVGFGSCSAQEPIDGLETLGLLPG